MEIKICHVTSLHDATDVRVFIKECCSLAERYDVTLIAPNTGDCVLNDVKIIGITLPASRIRRMMSLNRVYAKMIEVNADIYHFHDPELMPLGARIKKEKNKKVIFDSHEDVFVQIIEKPWIPAILRKPLQTAYKKYEQSTLSKYSALISVTPSIVERLSAINPNTYMVTNYPIYSEMEDNRSFDHNICFAGGITADWMHEEILKAIENIDVRYLLAGQTNDDVFFQKLKSNKSWQKVDFYGKIPHNQVPELMKKSIAGMVLYDYVANVGYHRGSLGNTKLFENMMCGIPVIATDFELWKEIIDTYHCGICVNHHNINAITDAIRYLINNPDEAKIMGENGKRAVREKYNWSTQEKNLLKLYHDLTA